MATRLYITSTAAAVSPAFTTSFWESTTGIVRVRGSLDRLNTSTATVSRAETSSTNARDTMLLQVVSDALPADTTIGGTLTIRAIVRESSLAANFKSQVTARLVAGDGTHKANLYSGDTSTTNTSEWNTFDQARAFPRDALSPVTLAAASATAGDRIVIEMGYRALNTGTTTFTGYLTYGDPSGATDIPLNETATSGVPWAEFSTDLWAVPAADPISTLTDDFTTEDTGKWTGWRTGLAVVGGRLRADADTSYANFLLSAAQYDLTGASLTVEVPTVPSTDSGTEAYVTVTPDGTNANAFGFLYAGGSVVGVVNIAGSATYYGGWPAYNATDHRWVRLREASGTSHVETSPDRTTWTALGSFTNPFAVTSLTVRIGAANWNNVANPGIGEFDNLNVTPNAPPTIDVGTDADGTVGAEFTRTASASDTDGTITAYAWTIQTAPGGSTATLGGAATATVTLTPDVAGTYTLRCTATDDDGATASDDLTLTAAAPPAGGPTVIRAATIQIPKSPAVSAGTLPLPATPTAGVLLITSLGIDKSAGTIAAPTDNTGATWTLTGTPYVGASVSAALAWKIATGTETTLTWDWGTNQGAAIAYAETDATNAAAAGAPEAQNTAETTATSLAFTGTTTTADTITFGCVSLDTGNTDTTDNWTTTDPTWTNGYTVAAVERGDGPAGPTGDNGGACTALAWKTTTTGATTATTAAWTGGADQAAGFLATFTYNNTPASGPFTATWTMATAAADTGGTGVTGGTLNPVNLATFVTNVTSYAYTGSPVLQFSSAALDMAAAVTNGSYVEIPLVPEPGVTTWTPTSLTLNIARGGSATPRGFEVRHPVDSYATNLPGGGDVGTQRTTWSARTIDLTPMGAVTGTQILRMYLYMPLVNSVPGTLETDSWTATGTYTAGTGNLPPTVNAGTDTSATVGTPVTRTATASDTDGTIASYQWTFTSKPATSTASLTGATTTTVTFTPDVPGTYTLTCTVTDDDAATAADAFTVTVVPAGGGAAEPPAGWFLRVRGDDLTGADGDPIAAWADTAGTTAFAQGNSSKRPYVSAGTLNGHDGAGFDAGDDALTAEPWVLDALRNRGGGTLGVVSRRMVVAAGTQSVLSFANGASEAQVRATVQRVDDAYRFAGRRLDGDSFQSTLQTSGVATDEGVARAITAVYDWAAAAGQLYRDGSLVVDVPTFQTAGATSDTASVQAAVGSAPDRVSDFASVVVYEVVVWPWALSAAERAQWHTYVQDTYGIAVSDYSTPATLTLTWGVPIA